MTNQIKRLKIRKRIRAKVKGTAARPRLSIYRSLKNIEIQAIDDEKGVTILGAKFPKKEIEKSMPEFANKLKEKKIKQITFDRGGFAYHGLVKKTAEVLREQGLEF